MRSRTNPNNASGAGPFRQHGTVRRDLRRMRVSRLPPANSQQERRHRQDGPSRRLREVLPAHRQSRAGRARTCGSVPVLRVQRRTAMTEDEQTIERIEAQIFERYQQSGIDYLVDYLEGEQSAIDLNFYPAHERAALINLPTVPPRPQKIQSETKSR